MILTPPPLRSTQVLKCFFLILKSTLSFILLFLSLSLLLSPLLLLSLCAEDYDKGQGYSERS